MGEFGRSGRIGKTPLVHCSFSHFICHFINPNLKCILSGKSPLRSSERGERLNSSNFWPAQEMRMRLSVLFLVFCGFAAVAGYSNNIPGYGRYSRKRGYRFNDDSDCQLKLYRVKEFQGKPYIVRSDRSKMRGLEKSVQTLGKCCWALYASGDGGRTGSDLPESW